MEEFMANVGYPILVTALGAVAAYIGTKFKKIFDEKCKNTEIKEIVETCVKAAEQVLKSETAQKKNEEVKKNVVQLLNDKGWSITELQLDMLIEAAVLGLEHGIKTTTETIETED